MFFQFDDYWGFLLCELSIDSLWHVFNWITFFFFANTFCILCILTMYYKYFSQYVYHYVTQFPIYFNPPCKQLECLHNIPECEREGIDQLLPLGCVCVCVF